MGDMNAHTSNIDDFICNDSVDHIPTDCVPDDKLMQRTAEDLKCKTCCSGKSLLDLCLGSSYCQPCSHRLFL